MSGIIDGVEAISLRGGVVTGTRNIIENDRIRADISIRSSVHGIRSVAAPQWLIDAIYYGVNVRLK